ncbi:hypothetical protein I2I05_17330 [Hymenobacter sp. BT683]|uniref:Glycosyltransferase RgtA/B/C/D-like domain-containing protein n=1 Tax=Hymenobacter jeongseonensis TaxID=2791027 RepID=A0ABS0ILC8_9BACT|nr:hypothetical protein [Hymenobacter jeongseonensis]MBF9239170.1 hypothetical protein [Hymenobacter jeongseonensis]
MTLAAVHSDSAATDRRAWLLLAGLLLLSITVAFVTTNTYDSGDSIKHYLFARHAPQHPLNYLDSWAKPLFTLLASGPAQLGFIGMKLFQCGVVALSAWCAFVVARALRLPAPELALLFAYAAPDYFLIQFSGLTEPLFGLVLVGSVALAVTNRPGWSAALISWLPFVRSEGFVLIGLWVLYLAWRRQWRFLPLLMVGYVVFSGIGAVVMGELDWVFSRNPYATISVYGHGDWDHFIFSLPGLLGWVLLLLALIGGVRMLRDCLRSERRQRPFFSAELLLVYGSITVFIAAHTVFWALGLFNSFGLTRVLTVTTPLFAVVALNGLDWLTQLAPLPTAQRRIQIGVVAAVVLFPFLGTRQGFRWQRDFTRPPDQEVAENAAAWIRKTYGQGARPLAYDFPYVALATQNNFFDSQAHPALSVNNVSQAESLPVGTLVLWDDWFARTEGHVSLSQLRSDARFRERWADARPRNRTHPERDTTRIIVFERVQ